MGLELIITIETDGSYEGTVISFNGNKLLPPTAEIQKFHLSVHPTIKENSGKINYGKVKLQMQKYNNQTKIYDLISMFGDDFKEYDDMEILGGRINNGKQGLDKTI